MRSPEVLSIVVLAGCVHSPEQPAVTSTAEPEPLAVISAASGDSLREDEPEPAEQPRIVASPVVLVTVDGVRWQDIFGGADQTLTRHDVSEWTDPSRLLPHIHALVSEDGAVLGAGGEGCGVVTTAGSSHLSLPGYMEILSGRATTCTTNTCAAKSLPTVLDSAAENGLRPVASISSWEMIARAASAGGPRVVVSAGRRRWSGERPSAHSRLEELVESGAHASSYPAPGSGYRPDAHTAAIALEYIRSRAPLMLHIGFGDPDEFAHRGDYLGYLNALRAVDEFVVDLVDVAHPRAVIITTDHGRAKSFRGHGPDFPESGRSFVLAFGEGIRARGEVCLEDDVTLPDVGATVRALLELPVDPRVDAGRPIEVLLAGQPSEEK